MVAHQGQHPGVVAEEGHNTGRVGAAINRIAKQDQPIFIAQPEPVDQGAQRSEVAMHISHGKHAMASIKAALEVGFQRVIPSTEVRREFIFARQGFIHQGEDSP